jgi:hypothetical protein
LPTGDGAQTFRVGPKIATLRLQFSGGITTQPRGQAVRKFFPAFALITSLAVGVDWADPYKPNEAGVTMGHWHLNSRDVEANKKILVALGGPAVKAGAFNIVRFPGVNVYLNLPRDSPAATGGTVGTVINHVGFLVPNVQQAVAKLKALT